MNNTLSKLLVFVTGAAIGSAVTWKIITDKYSQIIEEELEEFKNEILEELDEDDEEDAQEETESVDDDKTAYNDIIEESGYRNYSNRTPAKQVVPEEKKEGVEDMGEPYIISPDDFDEHDDYEVESLTYYADGILADENDNEIEDVEGMVGKGSLNHFGEYEDDSVFVRNDERKTDYEILLDERRFADVFTRR